jgi:hypothetical protein
MKEIIFNKNSFAVVLFLLAAFVSLNIIKTLVFQILGIAFIVAFVYGLIALYKKNKFVFS